MSQAATVAAKDPLLRVGSEGQFRQLRNFFRQALFDESQVCGALSLDSIGELGLIAWDKVQLDAVSAPLRWCINIFMRGLAVDEAESRVLCGDSVFDAFRALGLLRSSRKNPSAVVCPVWVYPCDDFVIASDRTTDPDGDPFHPGEDVVFPAIYRGTLRFLQLLPDTSNAEALDLCGGSGIGALHLSRTSGSAVTADIAERSALFAEFNGHLNGAQLESVCGDLYEPLGDRQFDLISAHPPFVPAVGPNMVYRDGGDTGEEVIRRIVAGLPAHLRAGGECVILCVARDTGEGAFEHRARNWLGEQRDEFDLVFGREKVLSIEDVIASMKRNLDASGAEQLMARFRSFDTRQFVYGALFIRRYADRVAREPLRVHLTLEGRAADFQRLLSWRARARRADFTEWLADSHPRLATGLELTIRHAMKDGELVPSEFVFSIEAGFQAALRPDGWIVPLVARLDGEKSVRQVFDEARSADELPQGFGLEAFVGLVSHMIERGFLECGQGGAVKGNSD